MSVISRGLAEALDETVDQDWAGYGPDRHAVWDRLVERMATLLPSRVTPAFLSGVQRLGLRPGGIPSFADLNARLAALTGWRLVGVAGTIPDAAFYTLLAHRLFPAGVFIRQGHQLDYIEAPDIFHDVFGHAPMLTEPVFADFLEAYARRWLGARGEAERAALSRLFWFTVEFGLMRTPAGLRIYGSGIVSSPAETRYCLEDASPHILRFEPGRVMRTDYFIDDLQPAYFVIDSYAELYDALGGPLAAVREGERLIEPGRLVEGDEVLRAGTQLRTRRAPLRA
ncbi:MAG: phenylalanine 4-monooxygenase [Alphaproteobacteria bacterium]|nr:phenylalanine 4-monooxygenase [Alphaproteobacteria bacterium]